MNRVTHDIAFELVLEIHNAGDRAFLRSLLDGQGIDYIIQGETVAPYLFHSVPMRLMVRQDQAASVRSLLNYFMPLSAYEGLK
jgi:hypothetical protein